MYLRKIRASRGSGVAESDRFAVAVQLSPHIAESNKRKIAQQRALMELEKENGGQESLKNSSEFVIGIAGSLQKPINAEAEQLHSSGSKDENNGLASSEIQIPNTNPHHQMGLQQKKIDPISSSIQSNQLNNSSFRKSSQLRQSGQYLESQTFEKIQNILEDKSIHSLLEFRDFNTQHLLDSSGKYKTKDPLKACIFHIIDMIFQSRTTNQLQNQILKVTFEKFDVDLKPDILEKFAEYCSVLNQKQLGPEDELQIRKIFVEYFIQKLEKPDKQILEIAGDYKIVIIAVEVIALNFIKHKLLSKGENEYRIFEQEHKSQDGDYQIVFKQICKVFSLKYQKDKDDVVIENDHTKLTIEIKQDKDDQTEFVSYRKDK